jgi:Domain of unknown function (DUF5664)
MLEPIDSQRPIKAETEQTKTEPGLRYDAGKLRFDLLPFEAMEEVVKVYTVGAAKYAPRNWEKGMSWSRVLASLFRHLWKFWKGEQIDEETGCHHMAHVTWNALALLHYDIKKVGSDDRTG